MKKGRFVFSESEDGSVKIGYKDYEVESFGGGSYEAIYLIDGPNRTKLENILRESWDGTLKEMIAEEFGERLDKKGFAEYCDDYGIEYKLFTWIDD